MKFLGWYSFVVTGILNLYLLADLFNGNDAEGSLFALAFFLPTTFYCFKKAQEK